MKIEKLTYLDLDIGFQTFGAGSGVEISRRIRICGPFYLFLSSRGENIGKTKTINNYNIFPYTPFFGLYIAI